ncbi:MAG: HAD family phosphatase [Firmicutes bacterium]|nr:HAD family phosphatase [Bacillota bacterium]
MIKAVIFDLDGTLVKTERLKAISYGLAANELDPERDHQDQALLAFAEVVGRPRHEVAQHILQKLNVEEAAARRCKEFMVSEAWQALVQIRLQLYEKMIKDADLLRKNIWPYSIELLKWARSERYLTGLATASSCQAAHHVLKALDLEASFNYIATNDDVEHNKPDPEIYQLVASGLGVLPAECIVIEDSPAGVTAAREAGMAYLAVSTEFTRNRLHADQYIDEKWIVDEPSRLKQQFMQLIAEIAAT